MSKFFCTSCQTERPITDKVMVNKLDINGRKTKKIKCTFCNAKSKGKL